MKNQRTKNQSLINCTNRKLLPRALTFIRRCCFINHIKSMPGSSIDPIQDESECDEKHEHVGCRALFPPLFSGHQHKNGTLAAFSSEASVVLLAKFSHPFSLMILVPSIFPKNFIFCPRIKLKIDLKSSH